MDALEGEICRLAGQLAAATCRWLDLVAEFDRRDGAAAWGMASTAEWLSFRCALSPGAAREQVRVARALGELPLLHEQLAAGALSYSQARAISRLAVRLPEIEAELVEHARHMSAAQLEELCRGIRAGDDADRPLRRGRRYLRRYYDEAGWLVIHGRIPPEEGALIDAALDAWEADDSRHGDEKSAEDVGDDSGAVSESGRCGSDSAHTTLDQHREQGSENLATDPDEDADPDGQPRHERHAADALVAMAEALLAHGVPDSRADRYQVIIQVDASTLFDSAPGRCRIADGPALHPDTARRLACQASTAAMLVNGPFEVLNLARASRTPNTAQRRALLRRDQGRCRFPGCRARRHVEAHHIVWWSLGGSTDLDNLILLCRRHHTLVHEGGYRISCDGPASFTFRRPDSTPVGQPGLAGQQPADRPLGDETTAILHPAITPDTLPPKWGADRGRIDYPYAIACFLDAAHHRRRATDDAA